MSAFGTDARFQAEARDRAPLPGVAAEGAVAADGGLQRGELQLGLRLVDPSEVVLRDVDRPGVKGFLARVAVLESGGEGAVGLVLGAFDEIGAARQPD